MRRPQVNLVRQTIRTCLAQRFPRKDNIAAILLKTRHSAWKDPNTSKRTKPPLECSQTTAAFFRRQVYPTESRVVLIVQLCVHCSKRGRKQTTGKFRGCMLDAPIGDQVQRSCKDIYPPWCIKFSVPKTLLQS